MNVWKKIISDTRGLPPNPLVWTYQGQISGYLETIRETGKRLDYMRWYIRTALESEFVIWMSKGAFKPAKLLAELNGTVTFFDKTVARLAQFETFIRQDLAVADSEEMCLFLREQVRGVTTNLPRFMRMAHRRIDSLATRFASLVTDEPAAADIFFRVLAELQQHNDMLKSFCTEAKRRWMVSDAAGRYTLLVEVEKLRRQDRLFRNSMEFYCQELISGIRILDREIGMAEDLLMSVADTIDLDRLDRYATELRHLWKRKRGVLTDCYDVADRMYADTRQIRHDLLDVCREMLK